MASNPAPSSCSSAEEERSPTRTSVAPSFTAWTAVVSSWMGRVRRRATTTPTATPSSAAATPIPIAATTRCSRSWATSVGVTTRGKVSTSVPTSTEPTRTGSRSEDPALPPRSAPPTTTVRPWGSTTLTRVCTSRARSTTGRTSARSQLPPER